MSDLIWAAALFVPLMTAVLGLLGPARRALTRWGDSLAASQAERDAKAALDLAEAEESRHKLTVRKEHLPDEVRFEQARLAAETAQYETEAEAARQCLPAAVEARRKALEARGEAEAAIAPETARRALDASDGEVMREVREAYAAYCASCPGTPWSLGQWIDGFEGVPRG